jgi:RNA polymerase sigma-70 factor (ECF subfamily)
MLPATDATDRRLLWGLAYRMTGSAADADDIVQETLARLLEHPPPRTSEPLRPWLVRVAMNVARDVLRRRKRRSYTGPWLPSPLDSDEENQEASTALAADARYEQRESASYAFLAALEALTAQQRAVLMLRDVLDYSVLETADALGLSEGNVKTTHHRARRAMAAYDASRRPAPSDLAADTRAALERFLGAILGEDPTAAEACLADGVRLLSDGGGQFHAALRPVVGRDRVTRFFLGLARKNGAIGRFEVRALNGLPAVVAEYDAVPDGWGKRFVMRCDVDREGRIREVHVIVASAKLTRVAAIGGADGGKQMTMESAAHGLSN